MKIFLDKSINPTLSDRFHAKYDPVSESGCWLWNSSLNMQGYGQIAVNLGGGKSRPALAHRVSWVLANGLMEDHLFVCHKCDTPSCVNPDHLFLGNAKDNSDDRDRKGRTNRISTFIGTAHPRAIMTEAQVIEIYNSKKRTRDLVKEFGVSGALIWAIRKGITWKTVTQKGQ